MTKKKMTKEEAEKLASGALSNEEVTGTKIVKKETAPPPAVNTAPRGIDDEDSSDLLLPRIELLQSMSPTVQNGLGKAGELVNQISKTPLPTDVFIPVAMHRKYIKWVPRSEGGGIEYQTNDPKDPRVIEDTKWGAHGQKPTCTKYLNFLVLLEGQTLPIVLSFAMTSYQAGRKLYTMAKMSGGDIWSRKYKLHSISKTNNMGSFFVFDVTEVGDTDPETQKICEKLYNAFSTRDLSFEVDAGATKSEAGKDEDF